MPGGSIICPLPKIDVLDDQGSETDDSTWSLSGYDALASNMVEIVGYRNQNTSGIYEVADSRKTVTPFSGSDRWGDSVNLQIGADSSVTPDGSDTGVSFSSGDFGYFFTTPQGMFYSDTALNDDGFDHMVAFEGVDDTIWLRPRTGPEVWTAEAAVIGLQDLYASVIWTSTTGSCSPRGSRRTAPPSARRHRAFPNPAPSPS